MAKNDYPIHAAAAMFPQMTDEEFVGLKEDIRHNGLNNPIVLWKDAVVDGRHRLRACLQLDIKPEFTQLSDDADPVAYVVSCNLHRRHLTTSQRAFIAARLATLKAGMNQHSVTKLPAPGSSNSEVLQNCKTSHGSSLGAAAALMNVSKRTVSSASFVQDHGCRALNDCIESGKISASLAETFCKVITDPKEQAKIAKRGPRSIMRELRERNAMPQDPPHQQAKNLRSIIQQHLDKAVRAIDDLNRVNQNRPAQMAAIKLIQAVKLW